MTSRYEPVHRSIERWYREALTVVEPRAAVLNALAWSDGVLQVDGARVPLPGNARLIVIAIGKAAPAMGRGVIDLLGSRIDQGIVLTKHGHLEGPVGDFECFEAGHPIPDEEGVSATERIVDVLHGASAGDVVLALISGGGSALLELPREPLTLDDLQETTRTLMHAGAGIHDLNAVRSVLSRVKGGGLRQIIGEARCVSLLLSDVLGNDPRVIASGPTIRATPSRERAREVLSRYSVEESLPPAVRRVLRQELPVVSTPDADDDVCTVIADNAAMVEEFQRLVVADGLSAQVLWQAYDGDAQKLGHRMVADAQLAGPGVDVLLGGGEATVEVTGAGAGGRNTETALAAALALREDDDWIIASLASDGDDGSAEAAGAIADPDTIARGRASGVDAAAALANNDSATFFRAAGGLVVTGPTGTNVNDVYIAVRAGTISSQGEEECQGNL